MRPISRVVLVLALIFGCASAASAQTVRGTVVEEGSESPLRGVTVRLVAPGEVLRGETITDASGRFVLHPPEAGFYLLRVSRLGLRTVESEIFEVVGDSVIEMRILVEQEAIELDPLVVSAGPARGRDLIERRLAVNEGVIFTPEVLDSLRPQTHPAEIFRHVEDVRMTWMTGTFESGGSGPVPYVRTFRGGSSISPPGCMFYIVDHTLVLPPWFEGTMEWGVAELARLTPEDLVAVEVYRHITETPDDILDQLVFRNSREVARFRELRNNVCGVAIFWTEDGW